MGDRHKCEWCDENVDDDEHDTFACAVVLRNQRDAERTWRERVEVVLSDCYAQLDAVFDETLMRRVDEELRAAKLLSCVSPKRTSTPETEGEPR